MHESQVFEFDNLPSPASIHVLATHKEKESIAITDELHQIVESRFKSRGIPSSVIAQVGLLALKAQTRCCLDVLSANGERFAATFASLGGFPTGISRRDKEVKIVASNGTASNQHGPLTRRWRKNVFDLESGRGKYPVCNFFKKGLRCCEVRQANIKREVLKVVWRLHAKWRVAVGE